MSAAKFIPSLAAACSALCASAASFADAPVPPACAAYQSVALPAADQPSPEERASLKGCSSSALYYGIGVAKDPQKARKCAYLERGNDEVFGGDAMLMTLYANGVGATRSFELALRFACALDGAPAEMSGRIAHLEKLRDTHWTGSDFSLCDDISSGYMSGQCAAQAEQLKQAARGDRMGAFEAQVSPAAKAAFDHLRVANEAFIAARVQNEIDLSGTARSAFMVREESIQREDLLQMLEAYAKGKGHKYSAKQLDEEADKERTLFAKTQHADVTAQPWGTVTPAGIAAAEAAWQGYRDAFAAFISLQYPAVPAASAKAWLTVKRAHMLKSFAQ